MMRLRLSLLGHMQSGLPRNRNRVLQSTSYSTQPNDKEDAQEDSLSSADATWKTIFSTLDNNASQSQRQEIRNLQPADNFPPLIDRRRQLSKTKTNITAQESQIFEDILNLLFQHSPTSNQNPDKLPRRPKVKQSDTDLLLDKAREDLLACATDVELFNWCKTNVLDVDSTTPTLPYLLTDLMVIFRDTYNNPQLTLSLFKHVKSKGVYHYVLGCTTPAYNELIATKWKSFGDLNGVKDTLEEMLTNGVKRDSRTEQLVEDIRNDVMKMFDNEITEQMASTLLRMEYTSSRPMKKYSRHL